MSHHFWQNTSPGSRQSCFLPVHGSKIQLAATVVRGQTDGPRTLVTAGVHSAEYVGIQAAIELANELDPAAVRGCIILIPVMNPTGFAHRTMSVVYEDGKNLNRLFPGSPDGTLGERIAWTVTERLHRYMDAYIDLHSGDGFEQLTPYVYCQGAAPPAAARLSRGMAMQADVPYLVASPVKSGGSYNHAGSLGVPGVLLERGSMGSWSRAEVEADKKDVRNMLRYMGALAGAFEPRRHTPADVGTVIYENAPATGCWYPARKAGDRIRCGEILGCIRNYHGVQLAVCTARQDGVLLYQTGSLSIRQGTPMVAYSQLPEQERTLSWN